MSPISTLKASRMMGLVISAYVPGLSKTKWAELERTKIKIYSCKKREGLNLSERTNGLATDLANPQSW